MAGIAVRLGSHFAVLPWSELRKQGVKMHRTGKKVYVQGDVVPLWENNSWNDDKIVDELYQKAPEQLLIKDRIVDSDERLRFLIE